MLEYISPDLVQRNCRKNNFFLAFSLLAGLICGGFLFSGYVLYIFSLMRISVECNVSIVDILLPVLFPLLLSAFAVYSRNPWLVYLLCFFQGVALSFLSLGFYISGWLLCILFLFSFWLSFPVYYYFWLMSLCKGKDGFKQRFFGIFACLCLIRSIDIYYVLPLGRKLFIL